MVTDSASFVARVMRNVRDLEASAMHNAQFVKGGRKPVFVIIETLKDLDRAYKFLKSCKIMDVDVLPHSRGQQVRVIGRADKKARGVVLIPPWLVVDPLRLTLKDKRLMIGLMLMDIARYLTNGRNKRRRPGKGRIPPTSG